VTPTDVIHPFRKWRHGLLHLVPSRLELAWTLKNPTEKAQLLPQFVAKVGENYDLIIIDCAPTESILTTAAYRASRYIVVPVKPEFLATIGLPLLARSLEEHRLRYQDQELDMAGIVFNGGRSNSSPEQRKAKADVRQLAETYNWPVFHFEAGYSDSYPAGSRKGTPIFRIDYARDYVKSDFDRVGDSFLKAIKLREQPQTDDIDFDFLDSI
jgi:chromosome partitioning protein